LFAPFVDALTDARRHIEMRGCRYTAPPLTSTGSVVYRTLRGYWHPHRLPVRRVPAEHPKRVQINRPAGIRISRDRDPFAKAANQCEKRFIYSHHLATPHTYAATGPSPTASIKNSQNRSDNVCRDTSWRHGLHCIHSVFLV